jgi:hypothetical protein
MLPMLHAALQYEKLGLSVIPLRSKGKTPLFAWAEYQKRRAGPDEIRSWFAKTPTANIGIVTGAVSGIAVVDLDGPVGVAAGVRLGLTSPVTSLTGNGRQLFYKYSEGICNSASKIAEGIDIRGEGGYIVAPPSVHPNGKRYTFPVAISAAELPPFPVLTNAAIPSARPSSTPGTAWETEVLNELRQGNRNASFARLVGKLHHSGLNPDAIRSLLSPHADRCSFTDLDQVIASVTRYDRRDGVGIDGEERGKSVDEFLQASEPVKWICEKLIAQQSVGFVAGLPETLKTWILADLAVECARGGGKWLGLFPVSKGKVLFIDQERFKSETQRRFKNLISAKGLSVQGLRESLFIRCGTTTRLDLEQSFRAFRAELLELRPDLVIVDSFATFHTRNDNDRQAIQPVLESIKQLRTEVGCTFILIDHESKAVFQDKELAEAPSAFRMVGSVGKSAAAEFVLTARKYDDHTTTFWHTKSTLGPTVPCFNATIKDVPGGTIVTGEAA